MSTNEALVEEINRFIQSTVKFGRKEIVAYGDWLYRLSDEDFKAAGDLLFRTARNAKRTGDWSPLPMLGYWCREFQAEYMAVQDQRCRRPRQREESAILYNPELCEAVDSFAKQQTVTGDDAVRQYADWLAGLSNADFKEVGNIIFHTSKAAKKTGDWGRLPHLRYCDWTFRKTYRFIQLRRPRR